MKFFTKKSFAFLMAILMMFALVACGGEKKEEASATGTTNANGELVVGVTSFADTLEPTEQYFSWVITRYGVGENLVRFNENFFKEKFCFSNGNFNDVYFGSLWRR